MQDISTSDLSLSSPRSELRSMTVTRSQHRELVGTRAQSEAVLIDSRHSDARIWTRVICQADQ